MIRGPGPHSPWAGLLALGKHRRHRTVDGSADDRSSGAIRRRINVAYGRWVLPTRLFMFGGRYGSFLATCRMERARESGWDCAPLSAIGMKFRTYTYGDVCL
jgi:hypothetical protein